MLPCRWGEGPSSDLQPWRGWYVAVLAVGVLVPLPPRSQHPPFDPWVGLFIGDSSPGPVWAAERVHTPVGQACPRLLSGAQPEHTTALLCQLLPAAKLVSPVVRDEDPCCALAAVTYISPYADIGRTLIYVVDAI